MCYIDMTVLPLSALTVNIYTNINITNSETFFQCRGHLQQCLGLN